MNTISAQKAYGYLRVSGMGQLDGDGFDRQRLAIEAYVSEHGIQVEHWYQENGVSGTKDLSERPALGELIADIAQGDVRAVIIEKLDRLARDLMISETIIADMQKQGITLISVAEPDLCSDDPSRKLVRQIFGAIAEYDRAMVVLKLRGARQRKRTREGRCEGRKPFGHTESERTAMARMTALRGSGLRCSDVAATMTSEGWPTRSGGPWCGGTVSKILGRASSVCA